LVKKFILKVHLQFFFGNYKNTYEEVYLFITQAKHGKYNQNEDANKKQQTMKGRGGCDATGN